MHLSITNGGRTMTQGTNLPCLMHLSDDNQLSFTLDLSTEDTKMLLNFMQGYGIPSAERVSITVTTPDMHVTMEAGVGHG